MKFPSSSGHGSSRTAALLSLVVVCGVLVPLWLGSDNVHGLDESTAYDRLALGLRTFEERPGGPEGIHWDSNFPLGTAVVFSLPWRLGLPPVLFGRLFALACALLALWSLRALVSHGWGQRVGLATVVAALGVPAFVRGAVISAEEAPYAAAVALGAFALVEGHRTGRFRWFLLAAVAVNATVLFRLDAAAMVAAFCLLGLALLGWRRGLLFAAGCSLSSLLHLVVSRRVAGPSRTLEFARVAQGNIQANHDGFGGEVEFLSLPGTVAGQLGPSLLGWLLLLLALAGAIRLLVRPERPGQRVVAGLFLWGLAAYQSAALLGLLEPRAPRYVVPLLLLAIPLLLGESTRLAGRFSERSRLWVPWVAAVTILAVSLPRIVTEAREARVPSGLVEVAEWFGDSGNAGQVAVAEEHPVFVVHSRTPFWQSGTIPPPGPEPMTGAELSAALKRGRYGWLVVLPSHPGPLALEGPGSPSLTLRFASEEARIYQTAEGEGP